MTHIRTRRDTAANWTTANPVLRLGEVGRETDTRKGKMGDGVTAWNALPYFNTEKADLNSPTFTGDPKAPTPVTSDNDTSIATTAYVKANLASYAPLASPTFTGDPKAPTPATADNDTSIATTAFVKAQAYAPLASPTFTGDPQAPTPAVGDNDNSIATTKFVKDQAYATLASPTFTGDPKAPTPAVADNDTSIATTAFVKSARPTKLWVTQTNTVTCSVVGAPVVLTGLSLNVPIGATTDVIYVTLELDFSNGGNTIWTFRPRVDGVAVTPDFTLNMVGGRHSVVKTWRVTGLAVGTRVITATATLGAGTQFDVVGNNTPGYTSMRIDREVV